MLIGALYAQQHQPPTPPTGTPTNPLTSGAVIPDALARQEQAAREEIAQADVALQKRLSAKRDPRTGQIDTWEQRAKERERLRDMRLLAREAGMYHYEKGSKDKPGQGYFIIEGADGNPKEVTEEEFAKMAASGGEEYDKYKARLAAKLGEERVGGKNELTQFRVSEMLGKLARGDIGGAAGELLQPFGGRAGRFSAKLEERALAAREAGGIGGMIRGGLFTSAARLAGPAGFLAAQQAYSRINDFQQDMRRAGQATGEGFGGGLAASGEALRLARNPFDLLDRRTAAEMVRGVRSKGFKGGIGRAMQDSIGSVFQDLGTD
jgi:hypothetical protein